MSAITANPSSQLIAVAQRLPASGSFASATQHPWLQAAFLRCIRACPAHIYERRACARCLNDKPSALYPTARSFPGVGTGSDSESLSFWLGAFGAGQSFSHAKAPGLVFKCLTLSGGQATVTVCRKSASGVETLQTCAAGLDGDCDGLKGVADPDCASFLAPPPRCVC